jgi:hypothetical protein
VPEGLVAAGLVPFGSFSKPLRAALAPSRQMLGRQIMATRDFPDHRARRE